MNDTDFILTKEYKKFEEFCNSCKEYKYIGLCHGIPGIGKTLSALKYSNWDKLNNFYNTNLEKFFKEPESILLPNDLLQCETIVITASSTNTPSRIENIILGSAHKLSFIKYFIKTKTYPEISFTKQENFSEVKLIIIDEVDHLKYTSLEQVRNIYDQYGFGLVLIGMPGIQRRISRYPQLYSRVGFLHEFKTLSKDEMTFIIEHHLKHLGTKISEI